MHYFVISHKKIIGAPVIKIEACFDKEADAINLARTKYPHYICSNGLDEWCDDRAENYLRCFSLDRLNDFIQQFNPQLSCVIEEK